MRCPHCNKRNDFTDIAYEGGLGSYETGSSVECDHCKKHMEIVKVEQTTLITVRPLARAKGVPKGIGGR